MSIEWAETPSGLLVAKTLVTQAQWLASGRKKNPSTYKGDDLPVGGINKAEAMAVAKFYGGRLPTVEEWKEFAFAGQGAEWFDPVTKYAAYSAGKMIPVASRQPNAWGLYDCFGLLCEWTASKSEYGDDIICGGHWDVFPAAKLVVEEWDSRSYAHRYKGVRPVKDK